MSWGVQILRVNMVKLSLLSEFTVNKSVFLVQEIHQMALL